MLAGRLDVVDHLGELRSRLFRVVAAVAASVQRG